MRTYAESARLQPSYGWLSGLKSWWRMLVICLEERLAYRTDFALGNCDAILANCYTGFSLDGSL